jgi:hypothetical protein
MDFMKAIAIFIASLFTDRVIDTFVIVTPLLQSVLHVVLVSLNQATYLDRLLDDRLNGFLLDIGQQV